MAADRNVKITVRADVADFLRGAGLVESATKKMADGAKKAGDEAKGGMSGLAQSARENKDAWTQVGGALTTYGAAVTGIGAAALSVGISYNTLRQRSVAALTTLTGSAEDANAQMDRLDDFATNSPFARDVFIRAQQQLMGFGFEAEKVVPILDAVQNAVAATGGSNQDIAELVRIIAQVGAAGKITAVDLMQFGQRGVDAATLIGEQMGYTGAEIRDQITSGTLDADAAIQALTDGMSERFGGAAANVKETMDGAFDRVKAAVRDISADFASILVNPQGGGLLVDGFNALADVLRGFQDLPGPIKATVGALTGLSGVASLAAGGFLLMAPRIVETADAARKLAGDFPRATGAIRGMSRLILPGSAFLAGLGLLGAGLGALRDASTESVPGLESFTSALLDMEKVSGIRAINEMLEDLNFQVNGLSGMAEGPINDFGGALRRMLDPSLIQQAEQLDKVISFGQMRTSKDDILDFFNGLDGALTNLVQGGNPEQAAIQFERLVAAAAAEGYTREELLGLFPLYSDALLGLENDARQAADGVEELNNQFVKVDPSILQGKADEIRAANDDIVASFIDLSDGINDSEISLDGWVSNLEEQVKAQQSAIENHGKLIAAGLDKGFADGLLEQGPNGAMRMQQIADAIEEGNTEIIPRLNEVGSAQAGAIHDGLSEELDSRDPVVARVDAQAEAQQIADEKERLNSIFLRDPATVTIDGDADPAMDKGMEVIAWAFEQTGIMGLDAEDHDAYMKIDMWNALANNTVGMPILDSDPERAQVQLAALAHEMNTTVGMTTLDSDKGPADAKTFQWERTADSTSGTTTLNTDASSAYSTLYGFLNAIPRSVSVSVRAVPILGGLMGRLPGFDSGGYTGHGSKMQLAGAVHASEFVHKKEHVDKPGMLQFHTDLWKTDDLDGAYIRHKLRGYADGGPVARSAPSMSTGAVTAVLAPEHVALLERVAGRPVSANLSINGKQAGQLVAAGSPYADVIPGGRR